MSLSLFKKNDNKNLINIPVNLIILNKKNIEEEKIQRICMAINTYGQIYPVWVRNLPNGTYELLCGEAALRASKKMRLKTVPAFIVDVDQKGEMLLKLNHYYLNDEVNIFQEAETIDELIRNHNVSPDEIGVLTGKRKEEVLKKKELTHISKELKTYIMKSKAAQNIIKSVLASKSDKLPINLITRVASGKLCLSKKCSKYKKGVNIGVYKDHRILQNTIQQGVEHLRNGGVKVHTFQKEDANGIEIKIRIIKA